MHIYSFNPTGAAQAWYDIAFLCVEDRKLRPTIVKLLELPFWSTCPTA